MAKRRQRRGLGSSVGLHQNATASASKRAINAATKSLTAVSRGDCGSGFGYLKIAMLDYGQAIAHGTSGGVYPGQALTNPINRAMAQFDTHCIIRR